MFKLRFVLTLCLAFLAFSLIPYTALAVGDGWPVYGHDGSHTARSSANGPNSADIKWTFTADGFVLDPVVANDGTIYARVGIGTFDDEIIAVNSNGTLKWMIELVSAQFAFPTVGIDGKVYVINNPSDPAAHDTFDALNPADGTIAWSFDLGRSSIGTGASFANNSHPTVGTDGTIYIASTMGRDGYGTIYALHPDGTVKWSWDTSQDALYCGTSAGLIYCSIESSPALAPGGYLYFKPYGQGFIALDSETGEFLWRSDFDDPNSGGADPFTQSISIDAYDNAYTSEGTGRFNFYSVNPANYVNWLFATDDWNDAALTAISADNNAVFHSDNGGVMYSLDAADGALRWRFNMGIPYTGIDGTPVLSANGILYFTSGSETTGTPPGSHGYVYAVRADSGQLVWQYEVGFVAANLAMGPDGTLYVPGDPNKLYAFQCADSICALPAHNPHHTVTNLNDSGAGSLRQAVADSFYGDTIDFQPGLHGTIALASPISVGVRLTINGPGANVITLDGGDAHAVLNVAPFRGLDINNLTIANGSPGMTAGGFTNVSHMVFTSNDNHANSGGAIDVAGATIIIDNSTFSNNKAYSGGAIFNTGYAFISSSTFSGNQATGFDGGAAYSRVYMYISNSTFAGNTANFGGALSTESTLYIVNSTITQNSAAFGGGIYFVALPEATPIIWNTIVANNSSNCSGVVADGGGNLQYPGTNCGAIPVGDPLLAPLADNGGFTQTMALQPGSAAIDSGENIVCQDYPIYNVDQRGFTRPVDADKNGSAICDIGAFEAAVPDPPNAAPALNYYTTDTPTLTWNGLAWATAYEVQMSLSKTFTLPFYFTPAAPGELFVTTTPLEVGVYYWRVHAKKPDGSWGLWSATESFTIAVP